MNWSRKLICRLFKLVPAESVPDDAPANQWLDLWDYKDAKVFWPRITKTQVWKEDLRPAYKHMLLKAMRALAMETDPTRFVALQQRVLLLNDLLEIPARAEAMADAALNNALASGNVRHLDEELRKVNR